MLEAEPKLASVIDAYATHPYPEPKNRGPRDRSMPPPFRFDRARLTRKIAAGHAAVKPIWITEVGWSSAAGSADAVTEDQQARFLADGVVQALTAQKVERIFVYTWDRSSGAAGDREGNYGLRRPDGRPKPAWTRLTRLLGA
jgi:exo-beta-1,3-glucanase (GH17 family)